MLSPLEFIKTFIGIQLGGFTAGAISNVSNPEKLIALVKDRDRQVRDEMLTSPERYVVAQALVELADRLTSKSPRAVQLVLLAAKLEKV